jgi:hypothetical protein
MPLATQTWAQSAVQSVAGSGDSVAEVLSAIHTLVTADANWNVGTDGTAATPAYLEVVSAVAMGAAGQIFKLLLVDGSTVNAAWTMGDAGNWASGGDFNYGGGTGAKDPEDLYVGYCAPPSNGTSTTATLTTGDIFNATGPYGGTAASSLTRFSSYVKMANNFADTGNNYNIANVWLLSCPEMLIIVLEDALGRIKYVHAGALIAPLSDAAGETISSSVGRIYGMTVPHSFAGMEPDPTDPDEIFWGNATATSQNQGGGWTPEPANQTGVTSAQSVLLCHYPEDNSVRPAFNLLSAIPTRAAGSTGSQQGGIGNGALMDTAGNLAAIPIPIVDGTTLVRVSTQLVGIMRQVKALNNSLCRGTVQDAIPTIVGFALTGSRTAVTQGFLISNS